MPPTTDQELTSLLRNTANKDAQSFRQLYELTSPKLFGFVLRILIKHEWAEEALQESFVSIWNNAASYQSSLAAPMTWMTTIVRNKAFDILRRHNSALDIDGTTIDQEITENMESAAHTPPESLQLTQGAHELARCFKGLEGLQRQSIVLAYYHDFSHSEIAGQLQLPIGTVKTWIRRGLERLRLCLSKPEQA